MDMASMAIHATISVDILQIRTGLHLARIWTKDKIIDNRKDRTIELTSSS
jgi:hypothetical protein